MEYLSLLLNSQIIGVIIGGLVTSLTAVLAIKWQFKNDLKKHEVQIKSQKLEDAIALIQEALRTIAVFKYKFRNSFSEPEKYSHRDHPEGENFLNFDEEISLLKIQDFFTIEFDNHCYNMRTIVFIYFPELENTANNLIENIKHIRSTLEYALRTDSYDDLSNLINTIEDQLAELRDNLLKKFRLSS